MQILIVSKAMDNRNRLSAQGMPTSTTKSCQEMNGNSPRQHARRRPHGKKIRGQVQSANTDGYQPMSEFQPQPGCWMPLGQQRLFPAMSDPAVGGYPMSMGYSVEQVSFPMYHPVYPHPAMPHMVPFNPHLHNKRCNGLQPEQQMANEYASLPPGNVPDFQSDQQRRFSDPGLANGVESDEDSLSCDDPEEMILNLNANLSERIATVARENQRLQTELQESRVQLQELKLEMATWKESHSDYEPGTVSDLVREVRDAMKVHQEAFFSQLKQTTPQVNDRVTMKDCEDLKKKIQDVTSEKEALNERLARLEEQMQTVMVHNSVQASNQQELVVLEQEKLKLRRELQEEIDARKVAESQCHSLKQMVNAITIKKKINGLVEEKITEREYERTGATSSGESLMSSLGSGSLHSPHVTMSGPVTDL